MIIHRVRGHFTNTYSNERLHTALVESFPNIDVTVEITYMATSMLHYLIFDDLDYNYLLLSTGKEMITLKYVSALVKDKRILKLKERGNGYVMQE